MWRATSKWRLRTWFGNKNAESMVAMLKGDNEKRNELNVSQGIGQYETKGRNMSFKHQNMKASEVMLDERTQKIVYQDGTVYIGEVRNKMKNGKGKLMDPSGDVYEGDFEDDKIQGKGKFTGSDGTIYEGEWRDGLQHGYGKESWPDGCFFIGYHKKGLKEGDGRYVWADGPIYSGNWQAGMVEGYVI